MKERKGEIEIFRIVSPHRNLNFSFQDQMLTCIKFSKHLVVPCEGLKINTQRNLPAHRFPKESHLPSLNRLYMYLGSTEAMVAVGEVTVAFFVGSGHVTIARSRPTETTNVLGLSA